MRWAFFLILQKIGQKDYLVLDVEPNINFRFRFKNRDQEKYLHAGSPIITGHGVVFLAVIILITGQGVVVVLLAVTILGGGATDVVIVCTIFGGSGVNSGAHAPQIILLLSLKESKFCRCFTLRSR